MTGLGIGDDVRDADRIVSPSLAACRRQLFACLDLLQCDVKKLLHPLSDLLLRAALWRKLFCHLPQGVVIGLTRQIRGDELVSLRQKAEYAALPLSNGDVAYLRRRGGGGGGGGGPRSRCQIVPLSN